MPINLKTRSQAVARIQDRTASSSLQTLLISDCCWIRSL